MKEIRDGLWVVKEENDGENATIKYLSSWPISEIEYGFPQTYCQHEYDCCGRWYQSNQPEIKEQDGKFVFTVELYRNV